MTVETITVPVTSLNSDATLPYYTIKGSAGLDLSSSVDLTLNPGQVTIILTGICFNLPPGFEGQTRGRSSLNKKGIFCIHGTIDSGYTGEVGVFLYNSTPEPFQIEKGMRIAQMVVARHTLVEWLPVQTREELGITDRGEKGWGSTGLKELHPLGKA
jgi:dUTP pyrophosphatase